METKINNEFFFDSEWNATHQVLDGVYGSSSYSFRFKNPAVQKWTSHIIKPSDLKVLTNETGLSLADAKAKMIDDWFAEDNEDTRERNNAKARERRAKQKEAS